MWLAPRSAAWVAALLILPLEVVGQAHPLTAPDSLRRIQQVDPLSGPPGTHVRVFTENLPYQARVHVGIGSIGAGFEVLSEARQGALGEVEATIRIPETVAWDRAVSVIALNAIFSPIAISQPFHVTNSEGMVRRSGQLSGSAQACLDFIDDDGYVYKIRGIEEPTGGRVVVEATIVEDDRCGAATTLNVVRVVRSPTEPA